MAVCFLIFFCVLIPNIMYFDSGEYRPNTASFVDSTIQTFTSSSELVRGSAQCSGASVVGVHFSPFSTFSSKQLPGCKDFDATSPTDCVSLFQKMENATYAEKKKGYSDLGVGELPRGSLYVGHLTGNPTWVPTTCAEKFPDAIPASQTKFRYCVGGRMNTCVLDKELASYTMAIFVVLVVLCFIFDELIDHASKKQDESEQTASDYAVVVNDPRPEATDPDDWKHFFETQCGFGKVVCVTVALNNVELMNQLALLDFINEQIRFEIDEDALKSVTTTPEEQLSKSDPADGLPLDEDFSKWGGGLGSILQLLGVGQDALYWIKKQTVCKAKIEQLKDGPKPGEKYTAVRVFVIFNDEHSQRRCLREMAMGIIPAMLDTKSAVAEKYQRNGNVLDVQEAPEPTNVLYLGLAAPAYLRMLYWTLGNFFSVAFVIVGYFCFVEANHANPAAGALVITVLNSVYPTAFKMIGNMEIHASVTSKKSSLLLKLVCARLFNTAIVTWLATPYEHTLDPRFIESIQMVLVFDMFLTPILRVFDIAERAKQFILAPRARTQAAMDRYFNGTNFWISERYTDLLKTAFVSLLYITLVPSGLLFACGAFFTSYWVDKYCLLRRWKTPPKVSHHITRRSNFYLLLCVVISTVYGLYFYSNWSYDNVCAVDNGCWDEKRSASCIVPDNHRFENSTFVTCNKQLFSEGVQGVAGFLFPAKENHMTSDQVDMMESYRILSMIVICLFFLTKVLGPLIAGIQLLYTREHTNDAEPSETEFVQIVDDDEMDICAYVPNCNHNELLQTNPTLMCDIEFLDEEKEIVSFSVTGSYATVCAYNETMFPDLQNYTEEQLQEKSHPSFGMCKYYGMGLESTKDTAERAAGKAPIDSNNVEDALSK